MQRRNGLAPNRAGRLVGALALLLGVAAAPQVSRASQVIAITPGAGTALDVGSLCLTSSLLCNGPGTNATDVDLSTPYAGITGQFVYTPTSATTGTMSFMITLAANATFGSGTSLQTMDKGSTFTATGINVSFSQTGSGMNLSDNIAEIGQATGTASISFASGLSVIAEMPTITNLNCSYTAKGGLCGVNLGGSSTPVSTGLQFGGTAANPQYNGYLGFDAQVTPVPLPASVWLLLGGLGCFGLMSRRRAPAIARALRR
jgi:hypothetical protein